MWLLYRANAQIARCDTCRADVPRVAVAGILLVSSDPQGFADLFLRTMDGLGCTDRNDEERRKKKELKICEDDRALDDPSNRSGRGVPTIYVFFLTAPIAHDARIDNQQ